MLQVVIDRLKAVKSDLMFAVDRWFGPYHDRAKYGLLTILPDDGIRRGRLASAIMSRSFRQTYGLVKPSDIDAIVNAAGFAFGDQWGAFNVELAARQTRKWKRRGIPSVFLPQAFGPFTSRPIRSAAKEMFENIDLVFVRDKTSLNCVHELGVVGDHIRQAPDFTNLLTGIVPTSVDLPERFACIVPNVRMLDRTDDDQRKAYIDFLATCVQLLKAQAIDPLFLYHDRQNDELVAAAVRRKLSLHIPAMDFDCPRALKGVLGRAQLVVGSRFHAIVGALSQGIPVVATGWSHKYEELLNEYGISEMLFRANECGSRLESVIGQLLEDSARKKVTDLLCQRAARFRQEAENTFDQAVRVLGITAE